MPAKPALSLTGKVILVAMTLWMLAMIVPDLYRVYAPVGAIGLSTDNSGVIYDVRVPFATVAESPAARAGLAPGDRIDLQTMRCLPLTAPLCTSTMAVFGGLGGLQNVISGRAVTLAILAGPRGPARMVTVVAKVPHRYWLVRLLLLADELVGIAVILIAFQLVWTRPSRMSWGFFLYVIWFNPGQTYTYYALLQTWPWALLAQEAAEAVAQGVAFAGLVTFALRFPHDRTEPAWSRVEAALPWLAAALALLSLLSFANVFGVPTETVARIGYLAGLAVNVATLAILLLRRQSLAPQDDQRMRWVIWGCAIGLPAFILAEMAQSAVWLHELFGAANPTEAMTDGLYLLSGVLVFFVSEAIRRPRVISVAIPLRRGTILTVLTLAIAVPVVYAHDELSHYRNMLSIPEWVWELIAAPVLLLVLHRLHEGTVHVLDRLFNHGFHRARARLEGAGGAMRQASTEAEIDRLLIEAPAQAFGLASAAVFRAAEGGFRRQEAVGWDGETPRLLARPADDPVLLCLEDGASIRLSRTERRWDRADLPRGLAAPVLAVPVLTNAAEPLAIGLFGSRLDGLDLNADERGMLAVLAERAAACYERVEIYLLRVEVAELRKRLDTAGRSSRNQDGAD